LEEREEEGGRKIRVFSALKNRSSPIKNTYFDDLNGVSVREKPYKVAIRL
jgi:hypothetical protein